MKRRNQIQSWGRASKKLSSNIHSCKYFHKSIIAASLLSAFLYSAPSVAQIPTVPFYPSEEIWNINCTGDSCKSFTTDSTFETAKLVNLQQGSDRTHAIIGKQQSIGDVSGQTLIVNGVPTSGDGVNLIYASSTTYSAPSIANAAVGDDNVLLLQLKNKTDGQALTLSGDADEGQVTVAASAQQGGIANRNSLLIRDSFIQHGTNAGYRNLITAAYTASQIDPDRDDGSNLATFNDNKIVIENSWIKSNTSSPASSAAHNINIAGVYLVGSFGTNSSDLSPFEANRNAIFVKDSEIDVNSMYVTYQYGSNVNASASNENVFWVEGSQLDIGFTKTAQDGGDGTIGQLIGSSFLVGAMSFDSQSANILHIKDTTIGLDQSTLVPQAVYDGHGVLTIAATSGGDIAKNNLTELVDVNFSMISNAAEYVDKKPLVRITTSSTTLNNYHALKETSGNTTRVIGSTETLDWTMDNSRDFEISGAWTILVQKYYDNPTESSDTYVSNNTAYIDNIKLARLTAFGGIIDDPSKWGITGVGDLSGISEASGNTVEMHRVQVTDSATIAGAKVLQGLADSNTVSIVDGQYKQATIAGALIDHEGTASGNIVTLEKTVIENGDIFGGLIEAETPSESGATGNVVVIGDCVTGTNGKLQLGKLYGGYIRQAANQTSAFAGNTLYTVSSLTTAELGGFQNYNFVVTQDRLNDGALITVTDVAVTLETSGELQSKIAVAGTGLSLKANDRYTLIDGQQGFSDLDGNGLQDQQLPDSMKSDFTFQSLPSIIRIETSDLSSRDYDLVLEGNHLDIVINDSYGQTTEDNPSTGDTINPETDVLMQASIASLASLYASDDLLVDTALKSRAGKRLSGPFAAARAGTWSNDASSRFDTDIYSGLLGWAFSAADVEFGPFVEMGRGNYEMSQGAEGHHNYVGAGVYANWQTPFYVRLTGYIKGGAMENNFHTSLVGQNVDFDNTTAYWGAHLGMNLDIDLTEKFRARPFLSYFYDGRESDSFTQEGAAVDGATFNFDTINAHRVQLGAMFEYAYSETARPYFGITYEHVIKAEANGTAVDSQGQLSLNSSDIEGATGIVSAGWSYVNPAQDFEFNFGVNGYGGTRNGVSAQMSANWLF